MGDGALLAISRRAHHVTVLLLVADGRVVRESRVATVRVLSHDGPRAREPAPARRAGPRPRGYRRSAGAFGLRASADSRAEYAHSSTGTILDPVVSGALQRSARGRSDASVCPNVTSADGTVLPTTDVRHQAHIGSAAAFILRRISPQFFGRFMGRPLGLHRLRPVTWWAR